MEDPSKEACIKFDAFSSGHVDDLTEKNRDRLHDKKKKQRRRSKRPQRLSVGPNPLTICFTPHSGKDEQKPKAKKKKSPDTRLRGPVLRPVGAQVPTAPNNSTQFIMDDHENSSLYVHFNRDDMLKEKETQGESDGSSPCNSDWLPYNVADFESAYQSAREDQMMNASRADLRKAILAFEAKAAVVSGLLSASPSRLLSRLQSQLLKLQEENASLKIQTLKRLHHLEHCHSSSSSSSSTSSSSSSSSSSDTESGDSESSQSSSSGCSVPDCNTCAQERQEEADEEKENTCPRVTITEVVEEPE